MTLDARRKVYLSLKMNVWANTGIVAIGIISAAFLISLEVTGYFRGSLEKQPTRGDLDSDVVIDCGTLPTFTFNNPSVEYDEIRFDTYTEFAMNVSDEKGILQNDRGDNVYTDYLSGGGCTDGDIKGRLELRGNPSRKEWWINSYKLKTYICLNNEWKKYKYKLVNEAKTHKYTFRKRQEDHSGLRDPLGMWMWKTLTSTEEDEILRQTHVDPKPVCLVINNQTLGKFSLTPSPGGHVLDDLFDDDIINNTLGDFMWEYSNRAEDDWNTGLSGIEIKTPDADDCEQPKCNVSDIRDQLIDAISSWLSSPQHIDNVSHAARVLVQEIAHDPDPLSSVYVYRMNGIYYMGPVWDFDTSFASPQTQCRSAPLTGDDGWEFSTYPSYAWNVRVSLLPAVQTQMQLLWVKVNETFLAVGKATDSSPIGSEEWKEYRNINDSRLRYSNFNSYDTCITSIFDGSAVGKNKKNLAVRDTQGGYLSFQTEDKFRSYVQKRIKWVHEHMYEVTHPEDATEVSLRSSGPLYILFWVAAVSCAVLFVVFVDVAYNGEKGYHKVDNGSDVEINM